MLLWLVSSPLKLINVTFQARKVTTANSVLSFVIILEHPFRVHVSASQDNLL